VLHQSTSITSLPFVHTARRKFLIVHFFVYEF
jgi:hypothetical protein